MKSEKEINEAIARIQEQDADCPSLAHKQGTVCLDVGHAVRGTWIASLWWVLGDNPPPWH